MSNDSQAHLAYGYHLGNGDSGWEVTQANQWGELNVTWYDADDDYHDFPYFAEKVLKKAGVWQGLKFLTYGHHDVPHYLLVVGESHYSTRTWGATLQVTPQMLLSLDAAWDLQLDKALDALGLTPNQRHPQWLICSEYS